VTGPVVFMGDDTSHEMPSNSSTNDCKETTMAGVRVHLWFGDNQAVQAAEFYAQHIPNSSVTKVVTAPEGVPGVAEGSDFIVEFTVAGLPVIGLNAVPEFNLDEAFSRSTCRSTPRRRSTATGRA
jgi:predicted 3-demethylubiquinone-9 3-methyltransferase (glyoxalase superfamily)